MLFSFTLLLSFLCLFVVFLNSAKLIIAYVVVMFPSGVFLKQVSAGFYHSVAVSGTPTVFTTSNIPLSLSVFGDEQTMVGYLHGAAIVMDNVAFVNHLISLVEKVSQSQVVVELLLGLLVSPRELRMLSVCLLRFVVLYNKFV